MPKLTDKTGSYRVGLLEFLHALRDVAGARGGIRALSRDTQLNRESLYRMLSKAARDALESLATFDGLVTIRPIGQPDVRSQDVRSRSKSIEIAIPSATWGRIPRDSILYGTILLPEHW